MDSVLTKLHPRLVIMWSFILKEKCTKENNIHYRNFKQKFQTHFLHKFFNPLVNKVSAIVWGCEISTWRTEHSNYLQKRYHGCNLQCNLAVYTLAKISQGWNFYRIPAANVQNKLFQQRCRTFIVQFPCKKRKTFLFAQIILEKVASRETLMWGKLFPCSGNP